MREAAKRKKCQHCLKALVTILLAGMISLVGCSAAPSNPQTATQIPPGIPQRADLLGRVALAEIINDEDFAELYRQKTSQDSSWPPTLDDALEKAKNETGLNLRDINEITVFADAATLLEYTEPSPDNNSQPYWGALVEGKVDETAFINEIEARTGQKITGSAYQNCIMYTFTDTQRPGISFSVVFPTDGQVVIGTTPAVKDVIDITLGAQEPLAGTVRDLYQQLGDALIEMACYVPPPLLERIPEEMPLGPLSVSLLSFRDINYATFTLSKTGDLLSGETRLIFASEDSSRDSGLLLSMGTLAGKYATSNPGIEELLSIMHISRSGDSLYLTISMTISEIAQAISSMCQEAE